MAIWHKTEHKLVLFRFRDLLEKDALAGIICRVEGKFVVMKFIGINNVFREAEPVCPPGLAVSRDRADEKVAGAAFYNVVTKLDTEMVYCYFDDKLSLLIRILHRPLPGFVNALATHLHGHGDFPARPEFYSADTDCCGGDLTVRLENESPAAFFSFPGADEKVRELTVASINDDLDAVAGRTPAAVRCNDEDNIYKQEYKSLHTTNFKRLRYMLQ